MAKTKALVRVVGFVPFLHLLPKRVASSVLVWALAKTWWDTTHTFHIAKTKMTLTPHGFHRMTGLRYSGPIINLEHESGVILGTNLLGHTYPSEHVLYFHLVADFRRFPED